MAFTGRESVKDASISQEGDDEGHDGGDDDGSMLESISMHLSSVGLDCGSTL